MQYMGIFLIYLKPSLQNHEKIKKKIFPFFWQWTINIHLNGWCHNNHPYRNKWYRNKKTVHKVVLSNERHGNNPDKRLCRTQQAKHHGEQVYQLYFEYITEQIYRKKRDTVNIIKYRICGVQKTESGMNLCTAHMLTNE